MWGGGGGSHDAFRVGLAIRSTVGIVHAHWWSQAPRARQEVPHATRHAAAHRSQSRARRRRQVKCLRKMHETLRAISSGNATGHYVLNLAKHADWCDSRCGASASV